MNAIGSPMDPLEEGRCREILEVSDEATLEEIHQAYHRLKRLYEDEHAAFLVPSMDEFSLEARETVLADLGAAHRRLCQQHEAAHPQIHVLPPPALDEAHLPTDGPSLRKIREATGATLEYLASETHVREDFLKALEEERFADLPHAAVNVRGFLAAYVTELGLPTEAIVAGYMQRYQAWQSGRR